VEAPHNSVLGWPLDHSDHFVQHAARSCFIPVPIPTDHESEVGKLLLGHYSGGRGHHLFAPFFFNFKAAGPADAAMKAKEQDAKEQFYRRACESWSDVRTHVSNLSRLRYEEASRVLAQHMDQLHVAARRALSSAVDPNLPEVERELVDRSLRLHKELVRAIEGESTRLLGVHLAQHLDAACEQLRSSLGMSRDHGEIAKAEALLHASFAKREAEDYFLGAGALGPAPSWRLFIKDMLGLDSLSASLPVTQEQQAMRVRLIEFFKKSAGFQQDLESGRILPEFLVLGTWRNGAVVVADGATVPDLREVEWQVMVGTRMSEPFSTCRLDLRFVGDPQLKDHVDWVQRLWEDNEAKKRSRKLIADIESEIAKSGYAAVV
jgi:hypothetical protein